jgi:hypothetical protein
MIQQLGWTHIIWIRIRNDGPVLKIRIRIQESQLNVLFWWAAAFSQDEKSFMKVLRRNTGTFFVKSVYFFLSAYKQLMKMSQDYA